PRGAGPPRRDPRGAGSRPGLVAATGGFRPPPAKADSRRAPARAIILLDLFGGPSHIDTFDPKPDAPEGIRGEFGTIPTVLPGVRVCEHLPLLARPLDRPPGAPTASAPLPS